MSVESIAKLQARPIDWLCPGRLALGKLAMLDGDPGLGKSLLTLDLCARLSTGRPFPEGAPPLPPSNCIILSTEDSGHDTIRPRLQAAGADLDRIFLLQQDERTFDLPLRLPTETDRLAKTLERTDARLVVLDPAIAFLDPRINDNSDQSLRLALLPLAGLAAQFRACMKLVRHLNKKGTSQSLYRGAGTIGFLAACRSGWLVARDPKHRDRRILAEVKNNLAPPQPSLAFTIVAAEGAAPRIEWLGTSPLTADELLAAAGASPLLHPRDRARDFLLDFLEDGPRSSREIWDLGSKRGFSDRTLYRARQQLDIRVERVYDAGKQLNYWLLPDQQLTPDQAPPPDPETDLEPWLAPIRAQFPPATPLDDL